MRWSPLVAAEGEQFEHDLTAFTAATGVEVARRPAGRAARPGAPADRGLPPARAGLDGCLLLTPHTAWYAPASQADLRRKSAETARDFLLGQRLRNCVNQPRLEQS